MTNRIPGIRESLIQDFGGGSSTLRTAYKSTYSCTLDLVNLVNLVVDLFKKRVLNLV
jgi:hypothetical protein